MRCSGVIELSITSRHHVGVVLRARKLEVKILLPKLFADRVVLLHKQAYVSLRRYISAA